MPERVRSTVLRLVREHGMKALRYCGVSAVNVIVGSGTFLVCLAVFDMAPFPANIIAWLVSTGPAYLMSRYWVWEQSGPNSVKAEIAPFWILALIGLLFSTFSVTIAGTMTENEFVLLFVQLCAYGVVWVAKYLVLDQLMWKVRTDEPQPEIV